MKEINSAINNLKIEDFIAANSKERILRTTDTSDKVKHSYFYYAFMTNVVIGLALVIYIVLFSMESSATLSSALVLSLYSLLIINLILVGIQVFLVHNLIKTPRYWNCFRANLAIFIPVWFFLSEGGLMFAAKSAFEVSNAQVIINSVIYLVVTGFLAWQVIRGNIKSILSEKYHCKISQNIIEDKLGVILVWLLILLFASLFLYKALEPEIILNHIDVSDSVLSLPPELLTVALGIFALIPIVFINANAYIQARFIDQHSEAVRQHYEISKERWYGES